MRLLGRKKDESITVGRVDAADVSDAALSRVSQTTAPKGRPTPRRDAGRKGPIAPAPMTSAEARARRKSLAGPKLSREERKAQSSQRRSQTADRRERMMAGDERYLLARDQGPVRRYVRDIVDSRRNLLGLFMPSALALLFVTMAVPQGQLRITPTLLVYPAALVSPAMLLLMVVMIVDGLILARKVSRRVDEKFPEDTERRWKLGLYATGRASQIRRMRTPRPQVKHGASVD